MEFFGFENFDELYDSLMAEVRDKWANRTILNDLELFNYSDSCMFEKHWTPASIVSRGLILCPAKRKIVARPFPKFFNHFELETLPLPPFRAQEKIDGSLGILYHWNGRWNVATRGSFDSEQANVFYDNLSSFLRPFSDTGDKNLCNEFTYLFEIVYPENRIVIDYGSFRGVYLLSVIHTQTGVEMEPLAVDALAKKLNVRRPASYDFKTIEEVIAKLPELDSKSEGFVCQFRDGTRVKFKGDEYVRLHRICTGLTPLSVWEATMNSVDGGSFDKSILPEEHLKKVEELEKIFQQKYLDVLANVNALVQSTSELTDKELGIKSQNAKKRNTKNSMYYPFVFSVRRGTFDPIKNKKDRERVFKLFRPTNNVVE